MGKFEAKIITALLFAVLIPLGASVFLVDRAVSSSYAVGVNTRIEKGFEEALESYRDLIMTIKESFEARAFMIASDKTLMAMNPLSEAQEIENFLRGQIDITPSLRQLKLTDTEEKIFTARDEAKFPKTGFRPLTVTMEIQQQPFKSLEAEFMAPQRHFERFESLGKLSQTYTRLGQGSMFLKNRYVIIYLIIIGIIIIVSFAISFTFARSITRRISALALAMSRVASGDLTIRVQPGPGDEVGELIEGFNRMVEEVQESRDRIEYLRKISAWQEMARRLAHEIKNPLTPIQLAMQQVRDTYKGQNREYENLLHQSSEIVEEEITTLRRLTGEFSEFAKLPEVRLEKVDIRSYLEDCSVSLSHLTADTDIKIQWFFPDKGIEVYLDRILFKRALDNLVRNAVHSVVKSHGREVRIRVTALNRPPKLLITVEDDGEGIDESVREMMFDPYYTTKEEGTGLGLAIVKKIVLEHRGEVGIDPEYADGARFFIRLPLQDALRT